MVPLPRTVDAVLPVREVGDVSGEGGPGLGVAEVEVAAVHAGGGREEALSGLGVHDLDDVRPPRPAGVVPGEVRELGRGKSEVRGILLYH